MKLGACHFLVCFPPTVLLKNARLYLQSLQHIFSPTAFCFNLYLSKTNARKLQLYSIKKCIQFLLTTQQYINSQNILEQMSSQGKLFLLASARRHQIQEAHKIGKIDFMTPKMAIKTILLTRLRLQKQKSSLVFHISPEICKDIKL